MIWTPWFLIETPEVAGHIAVTGIGGGQISQRSEKQGGTAPKLMIGSVQAPRE
jgi:hypothetical protein